MKAKYLTVITTVVTVVIASLPTVAQSTSTSPKDNLSPQEIDMLCKEFPQNDYCKGRAVVATGSEIKLSEREMYMLCKEFPQNSRCSHPASGKIPPAAKPDNDDK